MILTLTYLLTYVRNWALLEELSIAQPLKNSPAFYEPESSIPCSQEASTGPYPEPYQSNPLHRSCIQGIRPGPRLLVYFRNRLFLRWGVVSPTPNPQAGGPPLVSCPRLFIQNIRSWPPILEGVSSIRNLRTRHAVVTRDPPHMDYFNTSYGKYKTSL
jgi:hypothetical protein